MISFTSAAAALILSAHTTAPHTLVEAHSTISFQASNIFGEVEGVFHEWGGTFDIDLDQPERSRVAVWVNTKSLDTDNGMRDDHLRSADFFDVANYPQARFIATSVSKKADGRYVVAGRLKIKDVTSKVELPLEVERVVKEGEPSLRVTGAITINRRDVGIDYTAPWYSPSVDDQVKLGFDVLLAVPAEEGSPS